MQQLYFRKLHLLSNYYRLNITSYLPDLLNVTMQIFITQTAKKWAVQSNNVPLFR
jgi:hypothetical protein